MSVRLLLVVLFALPAAGIPRSQAISDDKAARRSTPADFQDHVYRDTDGAHRYVVFLPPGYDPSRRWPVILSLHGAGERGRDGRKQLAVGLGAIVEQQPAEFPAVIVFPQVEETDERILTAWSPDNPDGRRALAILAEVERRYSIDPRKRILTGWSMGGYGVWQMAAASQPGFWSAALSVSGGAAAGVAANLPEGLAPWAIHGADDRIVEPARMDEAVQAATRAGRRVIRTLIDGAGHDVWRVVYGRPEVRQWLFDPASVDPQALDWSPETLARLEADNPLPEREFRPSAIISRAVAIRIGNDAFQELARGIPEAIPRERLSGRVADIERSLEYDGAAIRAGIRNITWTADLAAAEVTAVEAERLVIRVGLRNLTLHASGGDLRGGEYEASCGPFDVVLGRFRPAWVQVSTRPRVIDGAIHLTERRIDFSIDHDNWCVTEPEWAKAKGKGLTPDLVKTGVVGGMYRAKDRVEEAVRELIPPLVKRIEERLIQAPPDSLASLFWPLPTAPPRIRLVAEGIRTDSRGVSVTVGLAVEGPSPPAVVPTVPTRTEIREGRTGGALVGIAPPAISSVASVFAEDPGARLDVRDAPDSALARLGDQSLLRSIAPGLVDDGTDVELRTVVSLQEPFEFEVQPASNGSTTRLGLELHAPAVLLEVSRRPRDRSQGWQKCIETRIAIRQGLQVELNRDGAEDRPTVSTTWDPHPDIRGTSTWLAGDGETSTPLDGDRLVDEFAAAWRSWTTDAESTTPVEDLAVGPARLRLNAIPTRGGRIWLEFEPVSAR